ncbi:hypothetical protein QJQ45_007308 [Haematococcus lacustris]|nr:hypothetical protein QJQ45_007308 [Haematococcus lacustris]
MSAVVVAIGVGGCCCEPDDVLRAERRVYSAAHVSIGSETLNDTKQRLQEVQEEHAREKTDWQQEQQDWQQQHQEWQQQQQDWQQRQQDWQQQQQLSEKHLHDLLQRADLHDHIIAVSAANELAQLKEQLIVAQARLAHQALGAVQLQQSVVRLTTAVCTAGARAVAAEASSKAAAAVAADASSDAHASAALLELQPTLMVLRKGITLSQLKQFCVRLNLATKGAKSRIQCLEAISQHQQKQHQQARAVATITPSKRHAPDSVMRMR